MHIVLFIIYAVLLCYLITRIPFLRNSGIRLPILLLYFGGRVATGCLHNWIAYRYYPGHGDIWLFFNDSFITRRELFTDVHAFWADNSTLAYLPHNLIEWMHVIFNFFSFDNLYINTLLFSFFTLGGAIALFRVFIRWFPNDVLPACCVLLLPSTLFWTTCIHTEGILYTLLGFFFYYMDRLLTGSRSPDSVPPSQRRLSGQGIKTGFAFPRASRIRQAFGCLFLFALAGFFRPAILIGLFPATLFWILFSRRRRPLMPLLVTAAVILLLFIPGISSPILHNLSARQHEFQALTGNSRIALPVLEPTWDSFRSVLPTALFDGFFQPLPGSGGQTIYNLFAGELLFGWLIIVCSFFGLIRRSFSPGVSHPFSPGSSRPFSPGDSHPFSPPFNRKFGQTFIRRFSPTSTRPSYSGFSCLLFSFLGILLIGYIIPFVGSIVRYRSIYLPFLLAPFIYYLHHSRLSVALNKWLTRHLLKAVSVP